MVERGKLGNYTLVPNFLLFKQEPGLMLQVCAESTVSYFATNVFWFPFGWRLTAFGIGGEKTFAEY
jgi:hypothetical protein